MKGFIVYPTYRILNDKAFICLFGRLENGESFVTINHTKPYFFIKKSDLKKAKRLDHFEHKETKLKDFDGRLVTKIIVDQPKEVPHLRKLFEEEGIPCYEADIRFAYRYLIDHNLKGSIEIEGDYEATDEIDRVYKEAEIKPSKYIPKNLKVLSIDIETDAKAKEIYCISLYTDNFKKVIIKSKKKLKNAISVSSEEELLETFVEKVQELDPDILTGWHFIDFDLAVLREKFKKYNIPFNLGRDNSASRLRLNDNFFRASTADVAGRMVLDGISLLKSSFIKLDSYKLDEAAKHFLKDKKSIQFKNKSEEITSLFKKKQQKLVDYNLKDAELVYKILNKSDTLNLTIQRSLLTGMALDRVGASIASLDQLYLREARERGLVCPSSSYNIKEEQIKGGFVQESQPGIYDYIIVLDFKSLYPSIIKTFNIDPASFVLRCKGDDVKAPNGACFENTEGILPIIIKELWEEREKSRKAKNELSRYAIKILMNSFFGVLASPSCRFFSLDIANAITHFGQHLIKLTAEKIKKKGYNVIYSDTDSTFVVSKASSLAEANKVGEKLEKEINNFYSKHIKQKYKRKSFLELEYEKCYIKFLMPKIRGKEIGAKKRYAGLIMKGRKEKIDVTGMEIVRSDWTDLAKKFQSELLNLIFHGKNPSGFINKFVKNLMKGKYDNLLVYRKSIRKGLDEYVKTTPPHVKAARKLEKLESNIIEYVITTDGPEPIQKVKHQIDYEHYLNKQIKPLADSILVFFGKKFEEIKKGSTQTSLSSFT